MNSVYRLIFYFFIGLVIISLPLLVFFREEASNFLEEQAEISRELDKAPLNSLDNPLNLGVLESVKFKALKNNVNNFNFDKICERPVSLTKVEATVIGPSQSGSSDEEAVVEAPINCQTGNDLPFVVKVQIKK